MAKDWLFRLAMNPPVTSDCTACGMHRETASSTWLLNASVAERVLYPVESAGPGEVYTIQRTWHAQPGSVSGARFAGHVPLGRFLPSTTSATASAALFGSFAGSTDPSDFRR